MAPAMMVVATVAKNNARGRTSRRGLGSQCVPGLAGPGPSPFDSGAWGGQGVVSGVISAPPLVLRPPSPAASASDTLNEPAVPGAKGRRRYASASTPDARPFPGGASPDDDGPPIP